VHPAAIFGYIHQILPPSPVAQLCPKYPDPTVNHFVTCPTDRQLPELALRAKKMAH
jgi:hypothetical protein